MKKILDFDEEGLKSVHFFTENLEAPIAIAVYTEQEDLLVKCMEDMFPSSGFHVEEIVSWCEEQGLNYLVLDDIERFDN